VCFDENESCGLCAPDAVCGENGLCDEMCSACEVCIEPLFADPANQECADCVPCMDCFGCLECEQVRWAST
jgi:hypothetical protein